MTTTDHNPTVPKQGLGKRRVLIREGSLLLGLLALIAILIVLLDSVPAPWIIGWAAFVYVVTRGLEFLGARSKRRRHSTA